MAIASAAARRRLDDETVVFGEVGLGAKCDRRQAQTIVSEAKSLIHQGNCALCRQKDAFISGVKDLRQALIDYCNK